MLSNEGARKEAAQGSNTYAKCAAQNGVKLLLTAPETAKFDTMQVTKNSDNAWAVTGYVTTKNLFGVPLRYRFGADVTRRQNTGDYYVGYLVLGDSVHYLNRRCF
ncbi:MAG TPA: hypothetical protein PLE61_15295 [Vicinamibacterales bacterium]|nr:hypothetical protein [Vicinamibacterales bacterium]